jgi:hypothetical protein
MEYHASMESSFGTFLGISLGIVRNIKKPHSRTKCQKPHDNFLNQN